MMKNKLIQFASVITIMVCLIGCGHSVQTTTKGVGIDLSWNGQSYIPTLRLGYWDASNAVLRGNTTYTTSTSTGGSLFNAGGSQTTTQLYTGPQLNEGNLEKILVSDKNSDAVKIAVIQATMAAKPPMPAPSVARTTAAAGGTGEKIPEVDGISTGMDKVIETAGDVAKTAVPVAGDITKSVAKETKEIATSATNTLSDSVQNITNTIIEALKSAKVIVIAIVILILIIGVVVGYIYFRKKKAEKAKQQQQKSEQKQQQQQQKKQQQKKEEQTPQNNQTPTDTPVENQTQEKVE